MFFRDMDFWQRNWKKKVILHNKKPSTLTLHLNLGGWQLIICFIKDWELKLAEIRITGLSKNPEHGKLKV